MKLRGIHRAETNSTTPQTVAYSTRSHTVMVTSSELQKGSYVTLFITTLTIISLTLIKYPLFPLQTSSLEWSNAWLAATVVDYYGACLCFSGVVLASEMRWSRGIAWVLGFCLLGSPACCLWVVLRLWTGGNLRLERDQDSEGHGRIVD